MQRHSYDCFFLDWDGCLAATLPIWMELCQEALAHRRIVVPEATVALELFSDWAGPARLGVQDVQAFTAEIRQGLGERLPEVRLNPETAETLRGLRGQGARTAILTASLRGLVEPVLERSGLREAVDLLLCLEDVQRCKPDPEVIHKALAHFQAGPERALMVGDSQVDIRTAHGAGVAACLYYPPANHRYYDLAALQSAGPERVIADLRELLEPAGPCATHRPTIRRIEEPMEPVLSEHFKNRVPSVIRTAQIEFMKRTDGVRAVNTAIGNVSLPMHPAMVRRLNALGAPGSPFHGGAVMYTPTVGTDDTCKTFRHVLASSGLDTSGLWVQVTDGGSQAMELAIAGVCGPAGGRERPLLIIDPTYTNYTSFARRLGRHTVSIRRSLRRDGRFDLPDPQAIAALIRKHRPGALLVIPYDNPTGQLYSREQLIRLARLCVEHNLWLISDEAYRELLYGAGEAVSIWGLEEKEVPGIRGRRIGIESSSKVWNACGLRIGALITDNEEFHRRSVAEATASLCANAIGQHIFAGLLEESHEALRQWYGRQRAYYRELMERVTAELRGLLPQIIVSSPEASIYSVVDVREVTGEDFEAMDFVLYCAREGAVDVEGTRYTLLAAPMSGFYAAAPGEANPGRTQMRIAYVPPPEELRLVPRLFVELLRRYMTRER